VPRITFIAPDGAQHVVEAECGSSLMEAARERTVPGIEAHCGGSCACATCHVYVDPAWMERLGAVQDMEQAMLECVAEPDATSRLSCQIEVSDALDGLVVRLPEQQG
jgi:2Fe-2S ferredoxin